MSASNTERTIATKGIMDNLFEHCHMDNPVFVQGMMWIGVFIVTYIGTMWYKSRESQEAIDAKLQKEADEKAAARARAVPLIQPLARPVEKKMVVPVVEVAKKAKKMPKDKKKQESVQMVE